VTSSSDFSRPVSQWSNYPSETRVNGVEQIPLVFIVMGVAWWYDRRSLLAEMREIRRIAQGLLDEMRILRERYGDRSEIADKILKPKQGAEC
jgi:hypothetical protein